MIIQWGSRSSINNRTWLTVTMPLSFTNTNYAIIPSAIRTHTVGNASSPLISTGNKKNGSFQIFQDTPGDEGGYWVAIGY